jgi:hypothetical protein
MDAKVFLFIKTYLGDKERFDEVRTTSRRILCDRHTVEHNYISPSSTVGIQLHVSALYVGHLQVVI